MKAILCNEFGPLDSLTKGTSKTPIPAADEVLIKVSYCGVNYPDILIVQGTYQHRPDLPFSPGGEVAGVIEKVGSQVGTFQKGDQVLAAMGWGGFAEYAIAKANNTYRVPPEVSLKESAVLLETFGTAIHALKDRALLKPGEVLLVLGASGGTGNAAIQLGNLFGARVIAVASTDAKRKFALECGANEAYDSNADIKEVVKKMGGADVVFDPVGGSLSEAAFRTLKPGGRHLVVGFASGAIPAIPFNLPLLKSASIVGVFWGHFWRNEPEENQRNVRLLLKWLAEGKILPRITKSYSLEDASVALQAISSRKVQGKLILEV